MSEVASQNVEYKKQESIQITYEVLFEMLRIEKNNDELQKIDPNFFFNTVNYLHEKSAILTSQKAQKTLFSDDEHERTEMQMRNIRKILQELYDRREKKILNMAINKSKLKTNLVDTTNLLDEERMMFDEIVATMERFRKGIIENVINLRLPNVQEAKAKAQPEEKDEGPNPLSTTSKLVRFVKPVPRFVGKELEQYGPYDEEDMANLPTDIADVLIDKGRAEEIKG